MSFFDKINETFFIMTDGEFMKHESEYEQYVRLKDIINSRCINHIRQRVTLTHPNVT